MNSFFIKRAEGALIGLAIGDALGTTVEFKCKGSFSKIDDIVGGGPFNLSPGKWTDDTSMTLCLADSLIELNGFDAEDQMLRYLLWRDKGLNSSTSKCFDIGNTVSDALNKFELTNEAYAGNNHDNSAGNGSLMRLAPIPLFFNHLIYPTPDIAVKYAVKMSLTTHAEQRCIDACKVYSWLIYHSIKGTYKTKETLRNVELSLTITVNLICQYHLCHFRHHRH